VNIADFTVLLLDDPRHPDVFQLTDSIRGKLSQFGDVSSVPFRENNSCLLWFSTFPNDLG